ncbi:condensation domain-containing protein [Xenorhabdus thailandensis]|uniref:condensation domain-containing protein n=1 Tax=Xenorhabdus thailandensis TaxID=3136255 RepID=UPI0030F4376D
MKPTPVTTLKLTTYCFSALTLALQTTFSRAVNFITLEGHGREAIDSAVDISETIGWFTTLYPVRLAMKTNIADTIIHTKEMLRTVPNKGIGYGALHQAGYLNGDLPAISFNYLGQLGRRNRAKLVTDQRLLWKCNIKQ